MSKKYRTLWVGTTGQRLEGGCSLLRLENDPQREAEDSSMKEEKLSGDGRLVLWGTRAGGQLGRSPWTGYEDTQPCFCLPRAPPKSPKATDPPRGTCLGKQGVDVLAVPDVVRRLESVHS